MERYAMLVLLPLVMLLLCTGPSTANVLNDNSEIVKLPKARDEMHCVSKCNRHELSCIECRQGDAYAQSDCRYMCKQNCLCDCYGFPTGTMNSSLYLPCVIDNECLLKDWDVMPACACTCINIYD